MHNRNDKINFPNFNVNIGSNGSDGQNANPCKNTAFEIEIHRDIAIERRVESNRCSDQYVSSAPETAEPNLREPLKFTPELIEYKAFLRSQMENSPLVKTARKTYDLI